MAASAQTFDDHTTGVDPAHELVTNGRVVMVGSDFLQKRRRGERTDTDVVGEGNQSLKLFLCNRHARTDQTVYFRSELFAKENKI